MKEETLIDYMEDRLTEKERVEVEHHLSENASSLEALIISEEAKKAAKLADLKSVPQYVTENVVQTVFLLQENTISKIKSGIMKFFGSLDRTLLRRLYPWKRAQFSTVRGSKKVIDADLIALKASFAEFEFKIEVDRIRSEIVNLNVILLQPLETVKGVRATLIKNTREIVSCLFQDHKALFEDIPFGRYTLVVTYNGAEKGRYSFEIKESRHAKEPKA